MFHTARLKLTAWYLMIIMAVCLFFSLGIYNILAGELDRFEHMQQIRIERKLREGAFLSPESPPLGFIIDPDLINDTKHRIVITLFIINGCILVASGGLGYLLAGRTLKPIKQMLDEQNRFVGDASHELRTPLTSLKSTLEVSLRDKHLSISDAKTLISESIEEVNKLQSLTDGLLSLLQHPSPEEKAAYFSETSIQEIISQSLKTTAPLSKLAGVSIEKHIENAIVLGNPDLLAQLFVILLDNAIKYGPAKQTITITSMIISGAVPISITDQGSGMDSETLLHIFDRFYRGDSARTKQGRGGYGLGLSIAKNIVELHAGTIVCESKPGEGSVFTVSLPLSNNKRTHKNISAAFQHT